MDGQSEELNCDALAAKASAHHPGSSGALALKIHLTWKASGLDIYIPALTSFWL